VNLPSDAGTWLKGVIGVVFVVYGLYLLADLYQEFKYMRTRIAAKEAPGCLLALFVRGKYDVLTAIFLLLAGIGLVLFAFGLL
jgi:hypothetical protein